MPQLITADAFAAKDPKVKIGHAKDIMIAATRASAFTSLRGSGDSAIIKTQDSKGGKNTIITMSIVAPLRTRGSRGNEALTGGKGKLKRMFMDVKGTVIAESVDSDNVKLQERSTWESWRKDGKSSLAEWRKWTTDCEIYSKFSRDCTKITAVKADGTIGDAPSALVVGDVMSSASVDAAYVRAKNGWTDADGKRHPKMKPYRVEVGEVNGQTTEIEIFVLLAGTASISHLTNDPVYIQKKTSESEYDKATLPYAGGIGLYDKKVIIVDKGTWNEEDAGIVTSSTPDWTDIHEQTIGGFSQYKAGDDTETEVNLFLGAGAGFEPFEATPDYEEDGATVDSGRCLRCFVDQFWGFEKFRPQGKTAEEKALSWHDEDYGVQALVATVK